MHSPTIARRCVWVLHAVTALRHADRRSAQGWRSQTEGEIFKGTDGACADPGTQNFPCHGGGAAVPPSSFISLTFTSHAAFFATFLGSKKVPYPVPPFLVPVPRHKKSETPIATQDRNKSLAISSRSGPCGRALTPSVAAKPPATPSYRRGVKSFAFSAAWTKSSPAAAAARAPCP